jgi:hypothetical protein
MRSGRPRKRILPVKRGNEAGMIGQRAAMVRAKNSKKLPHRRNRRKAAVELN